MDPLSVVMDNKKTKEAAEFFAIRAEKVFEKMGWTWATQPQLPDKAAIIRTIHFLFHAMTPEDFKDAESCGHFYLATGRIIITMMKDHRGIWNIDFSLSP